MFQCKDNPIPELSVEAHWNLPRANEPNQPCFRPRQMEPTNLLTLVRLFVQWLQKSYWFIIQYAQNLVPEFLSVIQRLLFAHGKDTQESFSWPIIVVSNLCHLLINERHSIYQLTAAYSSCPAVSKISIWQSIPSSMIFFRYAFLYD